MADIYHQVLINASKATVYEAVTTQRGLSRWWIADCNAKAEVGFVNEFNNGEFTNKMKVVALEPAKYVEWECVNSADEWAGTRISFGLSDKGDFTCLDFRHNGYPEANEMYATCNFHWARHLHMLKELCETGANQLDKDKERKHIDAVHKGKA